MRRPSLCPFLRQLRLHEALGPVKVQLGRQDRLPTKASSNHRDIEALQQRLQPRKDELPAYLCPYGVLLTCTRLMLKHSGELLSN
jgi:hypothetical protein